MDQTLFFLPRFPPVRHDASVPRDGGICTRHV